MVPAKAWMRTGLDNWKAMASIISGSAATWSRCECVKRTSVMSFISSRVRSPTPVPASTRTSLSIRNDVVRQSFAIAPEQPSTRTFISEGKWDALLADAKPGDVVLIQFGHNDGSTGRPERYAPAATLYRDNLLRMIWEAKGRGLLPVLVTPPARRSFANGKASADYAEYSAVMRELVVTTGVPLIDLEARSRELLDRTGEAESKKFYLHYTPDQKLAAFPKGIADNTHFSELGARMMAGLVAQELKGIKVPIAEKVLAERPDLARATPLGSAACH